MEVLSLEKMISSCLFKYTWSKCIYFFWHFPKKWFFYETRVRANEILIKAVTFFKVILDVNGFMITLGHFKISHSFSVVAEITINQMWLTRRCVCWGKKIIICNENFFYWALWIVESNIFDYGNKYNRQVIWWFNDIRDI